jgi:hypothetical protein
MEIDSPNAIGTSTGFGIPLSGTAGQILAKIDNTNYNTQWIDASGGTGSGQFLPLSGGTVTGNTFFGITSGITIDQTNKRIGINTKPEYTLDIVDTQSRVYYEPNSFGGRFILSGNTNIPRFGVSIPPYLTRPAAGFNMGMRDWSDTIFPGYGKVGDAYFYAGNETYGFNLLNPPGTNTEDYIRFYAGQTANGTTPDIHIQGSGTTRGYVGFGTITPTERVDVLGNIKASGSLNASTISATTVNVGGNLTLGTVGTGTSITNLGITSTGLVVSDSNVIFTLELMDSLTVDFYAPYNLQINSVTNIVNSPTTTILDDGSPYTLTNTIAVGSKITTSVSTASVVNLNMVKL